MRLGPHEEDLGSKVVSLRIRQHRELTIHQVRPPQRPALHHQPPKGEHKDALEGTILRSTCHAASVKMQGYDLIWFDLIWFGAKGCFLFSHVFVMPSSHPTPIGFYVSVTLERDLREKQNRRYSDFDPKEGVLDNSPDNSPAISRADCWKPFLMTCHFIRFPHPLRGSTSLSLRHF